MKVALFTNSYMPYLSGITISVKMLKDGLRARDHTVFVVCPKYPSHKETDPEIFRLFSLPATYPGYRIVIPYSFSIYKQLKKEKISLIHAHQPFGVGMAAMLLAKRMKIPYVYTFHTLFSRYLHHVPVIPQRFIKRTVVNYLTFFCQRADTIIVPSEMVRRLLVLRGVKTPIQIIPTGLKLDLIKEKADIQTQKAEIRKRHNISLDAQILLYSGRLAEEKNVPFLLEAFKKIRPLEPNVYFILVGGGPKENEYRNLSGERIIFTGQIPQAEVLDYCFAADLFIYASTTETQGLVLTEAKACGLPVVAVFGGGIANVIESGIDGYLVPRNQDKFVEHVLRLLRNHNLRKEMSIKAQEDSHARFSSAIVAKKVENVYNSLINQQGGLP